MDVDMPQGATAQPPLDPDFCPQCGSAAHRGHMVCRSCGATLLRTRYPMSGEWNRRLSGVAVSGWGWQLATGTPVHVTFLPAGIVVQHAGRAEHRAWREITDMAVLGPGTQSRQGYGLFPLLDLANIPGSAVNLGLQYVVGKASTTTTTRTFLSVVGAGFELVVFSDGVDSTALRWQLAPAFATWRASRADAAAAGDEPGARAGQRTAAADPPGPADDPPPLDGQPWEAAESPAAGRPEV